MNPDIQNHLRKWTPRRPSPKVHARLFAREEAAGIRWAEFSRWLVPALGCFLLVVAALSTRTQSPKAFQAVATNLALPAWVDGGRPLALAQASDHSGVNAVPAKRLEWSFGARPAAAAGSLLVSYTNRLMP